ncbi:protein FAM83C [Brachyhypopomus gauderio]|uniref:protein FAM83C n=1 Tax=Brachyhypopomus gauderio TaxID=698409 RepID=UPI004042150B
MNSDALRPTPNTGRKASGKLATRLEELKNPWRQCSGLELSHNETARLATDALLESGEKGYRRVLSEEKELNFLSSLDIHYITESAAKTASPENSPNGSDRDYGEGDTVSELTSGTYFPMMSDEEPPLLELGWPEVLNRHGPSETQIYFQRDKSQNIKDLIRSLISKAKKVIALVMDIFTDVDLFCDLLEASKKRKIPVYILLDEKNLCYFIDMCKELDIQNLHINNMRIRSICGETYCTKSGKKFTGQVQEKFMIIDCQEVVAGSYSFTWLSSQVHSNMILHFSGDITESFDREFRCLYADSQIIERFHNPDEEGLPHYSFNAMIPNMYVFQDRGSRERVSPENSSSQSSNSVSSVKAAPGFPPPVYKVTQEKKDSGNPVKGQERRGRGSPNGTLLAPAAERPVSGHGPSATIEWTKTPEFHRPTLAPTFKYDSYDYKNVYHNTAKSPPQSHPQPPLENKAAPKMRSPTHPLFNKFTDLFGSSSKEKDSSHLQRSPPQSTAFGGPDLSQNEPESIQGPPPPGPMPRERAGQDTSMLRRDVKRMTLGHSKLDLVNHYNKMKSKHVYSRFELKNNIPH